MYFFFAFSTVKKKEHGLLPSPPRAETKLNHSSAILSICAAFLLAHSSSDPLKGCLPTSPSVPWKLRIEPTQLSFPHSCNHKLA